MKKKHYYIYITQMSLAWAKYELKIALCIILKNASAEWLVVTCRPIQRK